MKIICRGAESIVYLSKFKRRQILVKERIKKGYRVPALDENMRKTRTKRESRLLGEASRAGVNVPQVLTVEEFSIHMTWLNEKNLKQRFNNMPPKLRQTICRMMGETVAALHSTGIIHGDLTTSNMIFRDRKLFLIDFGLGFRSRRIEDQATDLFLLFEALKAAHFQRLEESWNAVLKAYTQKYGNAPAVFSRLEKIKNRRRYK